MKTSITQIWMVCHLLPFAKVGQYCVALHSKTSVTLATCMLCIRTHIKVCQVYVFISSMSVDILYSHMDQ